MPLDKVIADYQEVISLLEQAEIDLNNPEHVREMIEFLEDRLANLIKPQDVYQEMVDEEIPF